MQSCIKCSKFTNNNKIKRSINSRVNLILIVLTGFKKFETIDEKVLIYCEFRLYIKQWYCIT